MDKNNKNVLLGHRNETSKQRKKRELRFFESLQKRSPLTPENLQEELQKTARREWLVFAAVVAGVVIVAAVMIIFFYLGGR